VTERKDPANCLDTEMIAAYIDGRSGTASTREQVESHLSDCEDCYELFTETVRAKTELSGAGVVEQKPATRHDVRSSAGRWALVAGGALAAAAALWLAVAPPAALVRWWKPGSRPELAAVVAAVGEHRTVEGRLTGGFAWGPAPAPMRAGAGPSAEIPDLQIATGHLMREADRRRTPTSLAAVGTARLAAGQIGEAIKSLEEAVALDPAAAYAWSDLSAAYLARSAFPASAADVPRALEASDRALALQPGLIEAQFNRALALDRLGLRDRAIEAWRQYLTSDPDSPWTAEARSRLSDLERAQRSSNDSGDLQIPRERLFDDLLPRWAAAAKSNRQEGARLLSEADALIRQMGEDVPDRLARDVLTALKAGPGTRVLDGLVAYGRGRALYKSSQMDAAAIELDTAANLLEKSGNALALSAALYRTNVGYRRREPELEQQFDKVFSNGRRLNYASLVGRSAWMLGVLATERGGYTTAMGHYRDALDAFRDAREAANAASIHLLLAQNAERRGEPERAWADLLVSLRGSRREGTLLQSALAARRLDWPFVAGELQHEAEDLARAENRLPNVVDALRLQALTESAIGRPEPARQLIRQARDVISAQHDTSWNRLRAEVDLADAQIAGKADAAEGRHAATRAAEYFSSAGVSARMPEVLIARARLARLTGDLDAARDDLSKAIDILITERDRLAPGSGRAAFAERARRAGEGIVSLEMAAGRPERALVEADRLRSWDLLAPAPGLTDLDAIRRALDPTSAVLYYAVGDEESFAWVIRRTGVIVQRLNATSADLRRLMDAVHPADLESPTMQRLFALTVQPLADVLAVGGRTIVVADGPLHALPFAALRGLRSRFLTQDVTLSYAPSLAALTASSTRLQSVPLPQSVLAVGNPRLNPAVLPNLPLLRGASVEARQVAAVYPNSQLLLEEGATTEAAIAALPGADVWHFAGHALVNDMEPEASALGLMSAKDEPLSAAAVSRLSALRLGLVVLAACEGLGGRSARAQGPMSLARAFLQAGIPSVVASRWLVDDHAAVSLSTAFHRAYRETADAAIALRRAQLELMSSSDERLSRPAAWAGWTVIGGDRQLARAFQSGR
jgi:CHAT domain-containing protein/tetratricopeptide (TPR) repeat protein